MSDGGDASWHIIRKRPPKKITTGVKNGKSLTRPERRVFTLVASCLVKERRGLEDETPATHLNYPCSRVYERRGLENETPATQRTRPQPPIAHVHAGGDLSAERPEWLGSRASTGTRHPLDPGNTARAVPTREVREQGCCGSSPGSSWQGSRSIRCQSGIVAASPLVEKMSA